MLRQGETLDEGLCLRALPLAPYISVVLAPLPTVSLVHRLSIILTRSALSLPNTVLDALEVRYYASSCVYLLSFFWACNETCLFILWISVYVYIECVCDLYTHIYICIYNLSLLLCWHSFLTEGREAGDVGRPWPERKAPGIIAPQPPSRRVTSRTWCATLSCSLTSMGLFDLHPKPVVCIIEFTLFPIWLSIF